MSRPTHLGTRYACWQCGTKFYDLNKPNPACPRCGADPREAPKEPAPLVSESRPRKEAPILDDDTELVEEEELYEEEEEEFGDDEVGMDFEDEEDDF